MLELSRKIGDIMEEKHSFRSVSLKADLVEEIEEYIKKSRRYRGVPEFLSEAARLRLEDLQKALSQEASS